VRRFLDELLPDRYRIPRYYGSKPDFGDLDVVVDRDAIDALGGLDVFYEIIGQGLGVTQTKFTGHVYATVYRNFQVDYFMRRSELFEAAYHYLSFNDLGNILGRMCKRLGLKYGEDGLSYVFRRTEQPSYKVALLVSRDWPRILRFLGLDVAAWEAGFHTLPDMFAWAVQSPWFSVTPYLDRDRDKSTERRARRRRTMAAFVDWLRSEAVETRAEFRAERDAYVPEIAAAFPEAELEQALVRERAAEAESTALREKVNGNLIRDWTGLDGKELGMFIRRFRSTYSAAELLDLSSEEIRTLVQRLAGRE